MNAKHYVSLEAAKKLIGYDWECEYAYNEINMQIERMYANANAISDYCSCPTLLEAMDWLEDRGIIIMLMCERIVDMLGLTKWNYAVVHCGKIYYEKINENEPPSNENVKYYTDRNECMQKAIEKALEYVE